MYKVYAAQGHIEIHVDKYSKWCNPRWPPFSRSRPIQSKNNDILMIIKTMLSVVIDTLCLTVIHIRMNLFI